MNDTAIHMVYEALWKRLRVGKVWRTVAYLAKKWRNLTPKLNYELRGVEGIDVAGFYGDELVLMVECEDRTFLTPTWANGWQTSVES